MYSETVELTPLRYFATLAHTGHMTRAARDLGVSQPALSAMLKKLEAEVGAPLLHRTGRGLELTEAGRLFLSHAEDALRRVEGGIDAVRQLMGLAQGSIRIGGGATATTYLLPPVVSAFRRRHPGLRFYIREAGSSATVAAVLSGELDLGIVTLPVAEATGRKPDLFATPLVEDELRLILPTRHPLLSVGQASRQPRRFRWRDLKDEPIVAFEAGTAVRALIDQASAAAGVTLRVVMELRSIEGIKSMVAAGIGVGFVSRFALTSDSGRTAPGSSFRAPAHSGGLTCADGRLTRELAIVRRADRIASPAAAEFERELITRARKSQP